MNINKKLNAQAVRETGASIEVFKSKNDNELYYKNTDNQLVNVMTDKIKAFNSYSDLPVEGVVNTFYIVGEDIYMWNGTSYFSITTVPVTPSEIVEFDTTDPNLGGTVFTPDSQEASNTLYVSTDADTIGQTWTWNVDTNVYDTYTPDIPDSTPFNLYGTTIDAGSNKTAGIERNGFIKVAQNSSYYSNYIYNSFITGNAYYGYLGPTNTTGNAILLQKGIVNLFRVKANGEVLINDAYTLPNVDGTVGQVPTTDGAGNVSWGRYKAQVQSVVSSASITPTSNDDLVEVTAQVGALTINNPTGTYANGQNFLIRLDGDGSAITFDTKYIAFGSALPATTTVSKTTLIGATYNSNNDTFECLNSVQQ